MTFQFRDDITVRTPPATMLKYIEDLEHALMLDKEDVDLHAEAHVTSMFKTTRKESELLIFLSDGRVHSKQSIHSTLYFNPDYAAEMKIVDVFICKLRRKLRGSGITIRTHWGIGYQVEGADLLKTVMNGGTIEWNETERSTAKIFGQPPAPHGLVRDAALKYLSDLADDQGIASTTSRALSSAINMLRPGSQMIHNLSQTGRIKIVKKPATKGGIWKLRLTA